MTSLDILVVDDHALVLEGLLSMLAVELPQCHTSAAGSYNDAVGKLHSQKFDMMLADLELGDRSALDLVLEAGTLRQPPKIIIVSMHLDHVFVKRLMNSGASGYVTKDASRKEFLHAIETVSSGGTYISSLASQHCALNAMSDGGRPHEVLSNRELEIMLKLAEGSSLKEIGMALCVSPKTVAVHKFNILRKTGFGSLAELARYCETSGLLKSRDAASASVARR